MQCKSVSEAILITSSLRKARLIVGFSTTYCDKILGIERAYALVTCMACFLVYHFQQSFW